MVGRRRLTDVRQESEGIYLLKPVWQCLFRRHFKLMLANAPRMSNVPGRKTDFNDALGWGTI